MHQCFQYSLVLSPKSLSDMSIAVEPDIGWWRREDDALPSLV